MDLNNDGCIDNLTVVAADGSIDRNSAIYPHKANYGGLQRAGVITHEFLHSMGYPDLYRYNSSGSPVGTWGIMSAVSTFLQYPLAYLRSSVSHWFTIPTVTESKKNYSIYAATETTEATKNNQAGRLSKHMQLLIAKR